MSLVTAREIAAALPWRRPRGLALAAGSIWMRLTGWDRINRFYARLRHADARTFLDKLLPATGTDVRIPPEDLKRLPVAGPFIALSHQTPGLWERLWLLKHALERRSDFKMQGGRTAGRIAPLRPHLLKPSEVHSPARLLELLAGGYGLALFPGGGSDRHSPDWNQVFTLIREAGVPVVPVYFYRESNQGSGRWGKWASFWRLRTASESFFPPPKRVRMRIGRPLSPQEAARFESAAEWEGYLRRKAALLAKPIEEPPKRRISWFKRPQKRIIDPVPPYLLAREIARLRARGSRLHGRHHYEVFLADSKDIPHILREISRLREVTFRQIGEGTGRSIDLDRYDRYYKHLFLWDNRTRKIAGAYRIGVGAEIYPRYGVKGFYLSSLFRFEPEARYLLRHGLELGRAFVVPEYQLKPFPLFLLWQGILLTVFRHPGHKYLVGGVSISDKFSDFSKALMIEFMKSHYYDPFLASYIRPRKEFKVKLKDADKDFIFEKTESDLNKLDKLIEELEPDYLRLPVLIKQYIRQNAKIIGFNVDPAFNHSVDALMYIRITDIPRKTLKPLLEEHEIRLEQYYSA
ncbi:MAG: GNAT family N-acetyltransferase [Chlorobi bacterium]|nr:GNAT family N-acetyltransferase [Chlorobiota bacterium]